MKLTKYGHACVRFDKGHPSLVVDPGKLTPEPGLPDGVETILITHEHFDHFDPERLATRWRKTLPSPFTRARE